MYPDKLWSECDPSPVIPSWLLFLLQDSEVNLLKDSNVQHMRAITAACLAPDDLSHSHSIHPWSSYEQNCCGQTPPTLKRIRGGNRNSDTFTITTRRAGWYMRYISAFLLWYLYIFLRKSLKLKGVIFFNKSEIISNKKTVDSEKYGTNLP